MEITFKRGAIAGFLASSTLVATAAASIALSTPASAISAGQYCAPKGAIYQTSTQTLLCARTKKEATFRWRKVLPDSVLRCTKAHPLTKVTVTVSPRLRYETLVCAKKIVPVATTTTAPTITTSPSTTTRTVTTSTTTVSEPPAVQ